MGSLLLRCTRSLGDARVRLDLMFAAVALGIALTATAAAAPTSSHSQRNTPIAVAARTITMVEKASLRLASAPGTTLKEKGTVTGTFDGSVFATITTYSVSTGAFKLTAYLPGGTLTLTGDSHDHVAGATGYAEGTARVSGGTGRFAHASGNALSYKGVVNRHNYYATTEMSGRLSF